MEDKLNDWERKNVFKVSIIFPFDLYTRYSMGCEVEYLIYKGSVPRNRKKKNGDEYLMTLSYNT